VTPIYCKACRGRVFWQECPTGGWWYHESHPTDNHDAVPLTDYPDWYHPRPPSERYDKIKAAMATLLDPEIPYSHEDRNYNCGECWLCISCTISLAAHLRREARIAEGLPS